MVRRGRLTQGMIVVLSGFLQAPTKRWYGIELQQACDVSVGALYPLLVRLERNGWVASGWLDADEESPGPLRRRAYWLTGTGQTAAREAVANAYYERLRFLPYDGLRGTSAP